VTVHVKSPLVIWSAAEQDSPCAALGNIEIVSLQSIGSPHRPSLDRKPAIWCHIGVSACQNDRDEITSMVVEELLVVRANPMMDAYREAEEQECPTVKIGTLGLAEWFLPANLEGFEFSDLCVRHCSYLSVKTADHSAITV